MFALNSRFLNVFIGHDYREFDLVNNILTHFDINNHILTNFDLKNQNFDFNNQNYDLISHKLN